VGQAFDLLGHLVSDKRLQGLYDAGMEHPPPLLEETVVGHLLGQGVLEGVDQIGKQTRLIQELGVLEMREAQAKRLFR
jgi:hypothetical protein